MFRFPLPDRPIFSKCKKKKNRFTGQRGKYFNLQERDLVLLTTIYWYDVIPLSLINIDTKFFKGCFVLRTLTIVLTFSARLTETKSLGSLINPDLLKCSFFFFC